MAVAAIIVGSDETQISKTKQALAGSTVPADSVSTFQSTDEFTAAFNQGVFQGSQWIWFLDAGMVPADSALSNLLAQTENSPSVTWLVPKLTRDGRPRELEEYGLTVTKSWYPISPVGNELDQAQHDHREDLFAASILGSLISAQALADAGGLNQKSSELATQYRLAIAMRLSGSRLLAVPNARVEASSASATFSKFTPLELRKAQIQLAVGYGNPFGSFLLGLIAPVAAILAVFWWVLIKRPERILETLAAGFWWFGNNVSLLAKRPKLSKQQKSGFKVLAGLRATREDIQRHQQSGIDLPAAIAEANQESTDETPRFMRSGGLWLIVALAAISWQYWPKGVAVTGGGLLPLGDSLAHLFSRAGASWQYSGLGLAAPSDPINWSLFALGALTFWAPSLSVTIFVFLFKPLAFAASWRLLSLVTRRPLLATIGALTYAFWPALTNAQAGGHLGTMLALMLLPLFVFTLARILQFGASGRRSVQTWTWVGTGSLLAAVISSGAPSLTPVVAVLILILAIYRFKRIGYLVWLPVPLLVIWLPYAWYLIAGLGHPMAVLTEPGPLVSQDPANYLDLLLGGQVSGPANLPFAQYAVYLTAVPLLIGLLATVTKRSLVAMWLWLAMLVAVGAAAVFSTVFQFFGSTTFSYSGPTDNSYTAGSPLPLLGLAALLVAVLLVTALDRAPRALSAIGGILSLVVSLTLATLFVLQPAQIGWSDGSLMPALVQAQVAQSPNTRVMVIKSVQGVHPTLEATVITGAGQTLEDLSTAYNQKLPQLQRNDVRYQELGKLAANLVSANGSNIDSDFKKFGIDYVLVPSQYDTNISSALDTVSQLQPVGSTDYGRLWQVTSMSIVKGRSGWDWSVTKQVQVAVLAIFGLLAVPTRRRSRTSLGDELELDAFEPAAEGESF